MFIAAIGHMVYGIIFFFKAFSCSGFELGVEAINGVTRAEVSNFNPAVLHYIDHLHVAAAAFIIAASIAVAFLSYYGVREGKMWAWVGAMLSAIIGLGVSLPMHYMHLFTYEWLIHLLPIYIGGFLFFLGAGVSLVVMKRTKLN